MNPSRNNRDKASRRVIRAFLAGSRFTQTGYGQDVEGAFRAFLNGVVPGDDDEFAADLLALTAIAKPEPQP